MVVTTETLRSLRVGCGMPLDQVVKAGAGRPYFPRTKQGLHMIEERGTTNYHIILALAAIYDTGHGRVAEAANPRK